MSAMYAVKTTKAHSQTATTSPTAKPTTNDGTFGKTAEQFASGEVAYLLNGSESTDVAFCQNLDNGEPTDATPVLDSTHGTVYQFTNCNHADTYTNNKDAKSGDHSWDDNGFCRYNDSHYAEPEQVNAYIRSKTPVSCIGLHLR